MQLRNWIIGIILHLLLCVFLASSFSRNTEIFILYPEKNKIQITGSIAEFRCAIKQPIANRYRLKWLVTFINDSTTQLPITETEGCFELTDSMKNDLILKVHVQSHLSGAYWCRAVDKASGYQIDGPRVLLQATDHSIKPKAIAMNNSLTVVVWCQSRVNVGSPVVGYEVECSTNDSLHWHQLTKLLSTDLLYWHQGLNPNTKYRYRVRTLTETSQSKWIYLTNFKASSGGNLEINGSTPTNLVFGDSKTSKPSESNILAGNFDSSMHEVPLAIHKAASSAHRSKRSFLVKDPTTGDSKRERAAVAMLLFALLLVVCFILFWMGVRYCWSKIYKRKIYPRQDSCIIEINLSNETGTTARKSHGSSSDRPVLCDSVAYNLMRYSDSHERQLSGEYVYLSAEGSQMSVEGITSNNAEEKLLTESVAYNVPVISEPNDYGNSSVQKHKGNGAVESDHVANEKRNPTVKKSQQTCSEEAPVSCGSEACNGVRYSMSYDGQPEGNYVFVSTENERLQLPSETIDVVGTVLIDCVAAYNVPGCTASNDYGGQCTQKNESSDIVEIDLSDHDRNHRDMGSSGTNFLATREEKMQQIVNRATAFCRSVAYNVVTYSTTVEYDYCEFKDRQCDNSDIVEIDLSGSNQGSQEIGGNKKEKNADIMILYDSEAYSVMAANEGENREELIQVDSDAVDLSHGLTDAEEYDGM